MNEKELILKIHESIESAQTSISAAQKWSEKLAKKIGAETNKAKNLAQETTLNSIQEKTGIIEGIFDGQNMIDGEGIIYPVPANYASKSKLIEGDKLKLTIAENGAFVYKQIELCARKLIVGHLVLDGSQYQILVDSKTYNVLYASVTFFRAKVGDQVTIIVPEETKSKWAAIENIIPGSSNE
ncbi:hypothetical protein KAI58_00605 [Candidatus Gracilibacteria bacterium]|nr:hypothetical protein [Candidatus Gracilibacteria bacterium]